MVVKKMSSIFLVVVLLALMLAGNFFIFIPSISADNPALPNLNDYLAYFYNRYSQHLDAHGFVFKTPDYDVENFSAPDSAREILSLALYYKYRALSGEAGALVKVKQAVLDAEQELSSRPTVTLSFSDGFAEMATISLLNSFPVLFESTEKDLLYGNILKRIPVGILAADTSNRAALSAVYWQFVLNDFFQKKWISPGDYERLSKLIYEKIKKFADEDITADGWYLEGAPKKFNPHYHLISAFALLVYGELTHNPEFIVISEQMTGNLRLVSFSNGMVEARIGDRPVGLGAQFYLGVGLLNYYFGYPDYNVYLNYGSGNRFFSDPKFPDRMEYHSTVYQTEPRYHDDISFSNLAELALLLPAFDNLKINSSSKARLMPFGLAVQNSYRIVNKGASVFFDDLLVTQTKDGNFSYPQYFLPKNYHANRDLSDSDNDGLDNHEELLRGTNSNDSDSDGDGYSDGAEVRNGYNPLETLGPAINNPEFIYGKTRLSSFEAEQKEALILKAELTKKLGRARVARIQTSWSTLVNAYIYGRYTVAEIIDTIKNGPRAMHPSIPAVIWRQSENYKKFLNSKK